MKTGEGENAVSAAGAAENAATFRSKNDPQQAVHILHQVFIPDLLIPITKFLGDDDVAIRFVCKPAHRSLQSEISRVTLPVLQGTHEQVGKPDCVNYDAMMKKRPYVTSVSNAEWARDILKMPMNENTFIAVVTGGVLDVVKWMRSSADAKLKDCWNTKICAYAARNGHLAVLQWARAQDPPCDWDARVCRFAAQNGHLAVLQWARAQDPPCPWDEYVCSNAASEGHLHVLQWARSQNPPCPWDLNQCIEEAIGHTETIAWLQQEASP